MKSKIIGALATAALAMLPYISLAQTAKKSQPPRFATREEIRACLDEQDSLKARLKQMEANAREHDTAMAENRAASEKLQEEQQRLDTYDRAAVEAFNKKLADHNQTVTAMNERGERFKKEADDYNADSLAYNRKCMTQVFKFEDRDAVLKERKNAAAADSAKSK